MKNKTLIFVFFGIICIAIVLYFKHKKIEEVAPKIEYIHNEGDTQGTTYSITYLQPQGIDLQNKIEDRLHEFDMSLSTYVPQSIISRINNNDSTVRTDLDFEEMFKVAKDVSERTNGAFDITVGPLVKAWGFGFGNSNHSKIPNVRSFYLLLVIIKLKLKIIS